MNLICPDCRGDLQPTSVRWAVCAQHGGRYEILFDRYGADTAPAAAATPAPSADAACAAHPNQSAVAACASCAKSLCALCSFDLNGTAYCSDCAVTSAQSGGVISTPRLSRATRTAPAGKCADHPEVDAATRCMLCAKFICATCDFALPGGVHVCPSCVESQASSDEISPKRKKLTYISLALATWSTILLALLFAGVFNAMFEGEGGQAADAVITNLILWPIIVGTGLGISALDKRLKNTGLMKAAAWWNGVLGIIFVLLMIIGSILG